MQGRLGKYIAQVGPALQVSLLMISNLMPRVPKLSAFKPHSLKCIFKKSQKNQVQGRLGKYIVSSRPCTRSAGPIWKIHSLKSALRSELQGRFETMYFPSLPCTPSAGPTWDYVFSKSALHMIFFCFFANYLKWMWLKCWLFRYPWHWNLDF